MRCHLAIVSMVGLLAASETMYAQSVEVVVPNGFENVEGDSSNSFPFTTTTASQRYHQVYVAADFAVLGGPHNITEIRFRPNGTSAFVPWTNNVQLEIRFSTTQMAPDQLSLTFADNIGPDETIVYSGPASYSTAQSGPSTTPLDFDIVITLQSPFEYDPALGNLLMEVRREGNTIGGSRFLDAHNVVGDAVSRMWASSSTALTGGVGSTPSLGLITKFIMEPAGSICYANCDGSTVEPVLNVDDFTCFINEYASAQSLPHAQQVEHYANCDGSTIAPALNVDDFTCFINEYAAGCP